MIVTLCIINNNIQAKAGKLLKSTSQPVTFLDEYEMRKVYSLMYDVFRCKYYVECLKPNRFSLYGTKYDAFNLIDLTFTRYNTILHLLDSYRKET